MKKEPPDKYRTLKIPLEQILIDPSLVSLIPITTMNKLTISVYQFLRLWIVYKFENGLDIPQLTTDIIKIAFKVFLSDPDDLAGVRGPKLKDSNLKIFKEFQQFYDDHYKDLTLKSERFPHKNLSAIINYSCIDILTNIENNIKQRFIDHLKRFVNSYFNSQFESGVTTTNAGEKKDLKKQMRVEIQAVKWDLINNTVKSDPKYHRWLAEYRNILLPENCNNSHYSNINNDPQKYLKYMFNINLNLVKLEAKQIQFFPLRTEISPKYIPLDTKALIDLFSENKNHYLSDIEKHKDSIWRSLFKLDHKIFRSNRFTFDYLIKTDGKTACLQFINKKYTPDIINKKHKMKAGRDLNKLYKNIPKDVRIQIKNDIKNYDKRKMLTNDITIERIKSEYDFLLLERELSDDKISQLKHGIKGKQSKNKTDKQKVTKGNQTERAEFPYLEELSENEIDKLKGTNKIYVDPGKRNLFMMKDDHGIYYRYSNKQRLKETKRIEYQERLKKYKDHEGITEIEQQLSKYNSKSCNFETFKVYIKKKNEINEKLIYKYENAIFKKYKWYAYINRKRSDDKLVNEIKRRYGKDSTIIIGDWEILKSISIYFKISVKNANV